MIAAVFSESHNLLETINVYMALLMSNKKYNSTFKLQIISNPFKAILGSGVSRCLKAL